VMQSIHARHVVLGAGAFGSATAYHLARRGEPVLLVEQFGLGHDRGSSHGAARITRHSYADARYARIMPEAFRAWRELEADAGETFYFRTGGISLSPAGVDYVERTANSLAAVGVPHRRMTGREWKRLHPVFGIPDDTDTVFEPDAGLLSAGRAVAVQVSLARALGGDKTTVLENCAVRQIDLDGDRPTLLTDSHRISADRLVVTAGAWIGQLLPSLGERFQPTRQCVSYFRPTDPSPFAIGRFPIFIVKGAEPLNAFYGMPDFLGGGVKVARHGGPNCDPDYVDRTPNAEDVAPIRQFLKGHLPSLADAPLLASEICLYTMAPDEDFVLGPWPGRPDVIVASPCSGHGFKFSCLIGRVLADLATLGETDTRCDAWRPV
jgi:sarcosine oxidase